MPKARTNLGKALGFRSGLEVTAAQQLKDAGVDAAYEATKLAYVKPETPATYTPDFIIPNGIVIETKGRFVVEDRKKHLLLQKQHPGLDIRFVFSRSATRISKASKTTYAAWCEKHGFQFADRRIPDAWLQEPADQVRLQAITKATK
jgi:hypothetical protein